MFGRNRNKLKPELTTTNVEYLGGHPLYPQSFYGWAEFMSDRLEIKKRLKDAPVSVLHFICKRGYSLSKGTISGPIMRLLSLNLTIEPSHSQVPKPSGPYSIRIQMILAPVRWLS